MNLGGAWRRLAGDRRFRTEVVVGMTATPSTIALLPKTLRSLERQSVLPTRQVVTLSTRDFPQRQIPRGIESTSTQVVWTARHVGIYNRVLGPVEMDRNAVVVTAAEGVLYPSWWLEALMHEHRNHPYAVVGYSGQAGTLRNDDGVLYPAVLFPDAAFNGERAAQLAPGNDDLWFWSATQRFDVPVLAMKDAPRGFRRLPGSREVAPDFHPDPGEGLPAIYEKGTPEA